MVPAKRHAYHCRLGLASGVTGSPPGQNAASHVASSAAIFLPGNAVGPEITAQPAAPRSSASTQIHWVNCQRSILIPGQLTGAEAENDLRGPQQYRMPVEPDRPGGGVHKNHWPAYVRIVDKRLWLWNLRSAAIRRPRLPKKFDRAPG